MRQWDPINSLNSFLSAFSVHEAEMKKGIHPKYYPNAKVICACGNVFIVGATKEVIHTDVCSACHPFFTGEQRIVDTGGRVERFKRRLEKSKEMKAAPKKKAEKPEEAAEEPAAKAKAPAKKATAKKGAKAKRTSPKAAVKKPSQEPPKGEAAEETAPEQG